MADLSSLVKEIETQRSKGQVKDVDPETFEQMESQVGLKDIEGNFKKAKDKTARKPARDRMKDAMSELDGMKAGGKVSSASARADGCAQRGKTRGKIV